MAGIGTVIDDKYEILKEIGHGGMSVVYLAMDRRLNKQWAVKEIRRQGNGKNDEIVINSLLAEANMMKRLDHPALPRIVDIIDNGVTIFVIMDYIEGESLDKILLAEGPQDEEKVIEWSKQIADALRYLHSQKPPIIYRDMKPANVMLKPEGNIKIIDFGIAREYKETSLADTTVLGTKGYAPPEQYSGQTDARSDIFALGMTMHHLLSGEDPRKQKGYAPVRQYNPKVSEGMEKIIDKCVEPAPEKRYQNCTSLIYDLEHPDLITKGYRRKQQIKLISFIVSMVLFVGFAIAGIFCYRAKVNANESDYGYKLATYDVNEYYEAIEIYPDRVYTADDNENGVSVDAYNQIISYYKNHGATEDDILKIANTIDKNEAVLSSARPEVAELYYSVGKLMFSEIEGSVKSRSAYAKDYFEVAAESEAVFENKQVAQCYYNICKFMTNQSKTTEHSLEDYMELFSELQDSIEIVKLAQGGDANYDRISLYYVSLMLINDQSTYMAGVGFTRERTLEIMETAYNESMAITSTLPYVTDLQDTIADNYDPFVKNVNLNYDEVEKRKNGV